jgi:hypothetical protein
MKTSNVLRRVYGVTAALLGVLSFFIIVGVFGLTLAIAGLTNPFLYSRSTATLTDPWIGQLRNVCPYVTRNYGPLTVHELFPSLRQTSPGNIVNLYWVTTDDHDEDWFILARTGRTAESYHIQYEGYETGDARAELILRAATDPGPHTTARPVRRSASAWL